MNVQNENRKINFIKNNCKSIYVYLPIVIAECKFLL